MPRKAQSTPEQEEKKEAVNAPADEKQDKDYKESIPGAKERIEQALRIMITAWRAAQLQTKAQSMMNAL